MTAQRATLAAEEPVRAVPADEGGPTARRWVTRAVSLAAASWLLFVVAHLFLSGRVWWWNLPDLAPPLVFLAVPALLLVVASLVRPTRRVGAPLVLVALVLGWPSAGGNLAALWHQPTPAAPGALTVFAWNTWYWDTLVRTGPGGETLYDPDRFYQFLRAQEADVYLLQEYLYLERGVWSPLPVIDPDRLRREFPGFHVAAAGELVTLSRLPIVLERPLDLRPWLTHKWPDLPPAGSQMPAYYTVKALRTDLLVSGRVVSFYNAHFHVPITGMPARRDDTAWDGLARHDLRVADYRAVTADIIDNPHPVVLAGDLNTSPAMRLLRTLPDRLVDATPALDSLYPASWAGYGLPLWRLDWVFTTTDVEVHRYQMVPPGDLSDHRGQLIVVSI